MTLDELIAAHAPLVDASAAAYAKMLAAQEEYSRVRDAEHANLDAIKATITHRINNATPDLDPRFKRASNRFRIVFDD